MNEKKHAKPIHAPTGGWIALVIAAALMIVAGTLFGARHGGVRAAYAPKGMTGAEPIRIENGGVRVDLNRAGRELLLTLPGIGDARADAIIAYRNKNGGFDSAEELMLVSGIGQKIYDGLVDWVFVDSP